MKDVNLSGVTATLPPMAGNGTHRTAKKNNPSPKQFRELRARTDEVSMPQPAAFIIPGAEPIDSPMWLLHAGSWLQGERAPSIPVWNDLTIERHNRIPAPGFLPFEIFPAKRPGAVESSRERLHPPFRPEPPESSLALLGWDPRAVCGKDGSA